MRFSYEKIACLFTIILTPGVAAAIPVQGSVNATSPSGQALALEMTIDDISGMTTMKLTGPSDRWLPTSR